MHVHAQLSFDFIIGTLHPITGEKIKFYAMATMNQITKGVLYLVPIKRTKNEKNK